MYVGKQANKSGSTRVQVIDKTNGYHVFKTVGSACDPVEIERLVELGRCYIIREQRQQVLEPADHAWFASRGWWLVHWL